MTTILTPEEVESAWAGASDPRCEDMSIHDFAAAIESAVVARLAERAGELPRADFYLSVAVPEDTPVFTDDQLRTHTASLAARVEVLTEALKRLLREFPTDTDMDAAGWDGAEINRACKAHDAARAALNATAGNGAKEV